MTNRVTTVALALLFVGPAAAWSDAAAAPEDSSADDAGAKLEEIVVTATRREERLQQVPLAVSAVTGATLEREGISETRDLTQTMPGLVFSRANTSFQPTIRGVGTRNANVGDESNVAVYVDGVYEPVMGGTDFDLVNVDRVEVLRGPQGTLFGRNATGGLINIITPDPQRQLGGKLLVQGGRFGEREVKGYLTGGPSDVLAADLSIMAYDDDGYIKNLLGGDDGGARHSYLARSKILITPTDRFRVVLGATYANTSDASSVDSQPLNLSRARQFTPPGTILPTGPWQEALNYAPAGKERHEEFTLQTRYELPGVNLETTSALQHSNGLALTDQDATPLQIGAANVTLTSIYHSNEVRLLSTGSGPLQWILGGYEFGGSGRFNPLTAFTTSLVPSLSANTLQNVKSYAGFGEANYTVAEHWRLTAGVRYTEEKRDFTASTWLGPIAGPPAIVVPTQYSNANKVTDRLSVQYKFNEDTNVYATYSTGFKSGVFNGFATSVAASKPTLPETLTSYEVGVKSTPLNWLQANLSAFHYNYRDIQETARNPVNNLVTLLNAAKARINGAELELTTKPAPDFNVRGYVTYLHARFASFPNAQVYTPSPTGLGDISNNSYDATGNAMLRAPDYTFGINMDYTYKTSVGEFGAATNIYYTDKYYWDFADRLTQPSYVMWNGELSWSPDAQRAWRLSIWGRNLLNKAVYQQMLSAAQGDSVGFERPRTYGGSVSYQF
jgi:iron complex outermembrane receptor protein